PGGAQCLGERSDPVRLRAVMCPPMPLARIAVVSRAGLEIASDPEYPSRLLPRQVESALGGGRGGRVGAGEPEFAAVVHAGGEREPAPGLEEALVAVHRDVPPGEVVDPPDLAAVDRRLEAHAPTPPHGAVVVPGGGEGGHRERHHDQRGACEQAFHGSPLRSTRRDVPALTGRPYRRVGWRSTGVASPPALEGTGRSAE